MGKFIKIFLILLFVLGAFATADAKTPPPGSGSADVPANILLMLDTSASMANSIQARTATDVKYPMDIAFDSSGNMYAALSYDKVIKYDSNGNYIRSWGSTGTGNGKFDFVAGIAIDSNDNVYVSDQNNARVEKFTTNGTYVSKFSVAGGASYGLDVDSSGNIYVANGNGFIEKHNSSGTLIQTWTGTSNATDVAVDSTSSKAYVIRSTSSRLRITNLSGTVSTNINLSFVPTAVTYDSASKIYITSTATDMVYQYNSSGTLLNSWGTTGTGGTSLGSFRNPKGIRIRPSDGKIFVADYNNHRYQSPTGELLLPTTLTSKLEAAQDVIKTIVNDSSLTSNANFGLLTWDQDSKLQVKVSSTGAAEISALMGSLAVDGNHTYLGQALDAAKSYFNGSSSPKIAGATCQQNILIVISDGYWQDSPAPENDADDLYQNEGIKTYVIGFAYVGDTSNYIEISQKGGTYPDSPLFAEDESGLVDSLSTIIRNVIATQFTFTVPTIIPGITNTDSILQSTFLFKKTHQWKGNLFKYSLDSSGFIGSEIWNAGEKLNQVPAANRKIWTVADGMTYSLNNFVDTNIDRLRSALSENSSVGLSDTVLTGLINFIRGVDTYGEYTAGVDDEGETLITGERWKLADIYHSKAIAVGTPSSYYSDSANINSESYFRYANGYKEFKEGSDCGVECDLRSEVVYVGSNDGMLHAFDSATGDEKWAFIPPALLPTFRNAISSTTAQSYSIYGVDGSPAVKDIYDTDESKWKTVLLGGLRQGGSSYFALDITNPDAPKHLFSFDYNKFTNKISYWDQDSARSIYSVGAAPTQYDYSGLGESWSDPLILNITIGGVKKWVGVFGGGYNNNTNGTYGNFVYIIDMEDGGKVLKKISIPDNSSTDGILNSIPPRLTAITADTTLTFNHAGALVYFTATDGVMWKINLTDTGTLYDTTKIFDTQATYDNDRMSYHEMVPTTLSNGTIMHFFGTGDINRIGRISNNIANRAYGVIDDNYPNFVTQSSPYKISNLQNLSGTNSVCPTATQKGWYVNLDTNEKITASPAVRSTEVIFSRYTPNTTDICDAGTSKISEHDFVCGNKLREVALGSGMATEAVVYKDKVYIGISSDAPASNLPDGFVKQGNLIIGSPVVDPDTSVKIEYWKEDF